MNDIFEPLEPMRIPASQLAAAFGALAIPVIATSFVPALRDHEILLWLLALVPAFLLAYYRGWRGVAVAMAAGMVALTFTHLILILSDRQVDNWPLLLAVVGFYVVIGMGLGLVTELLHREREQAQRLALLDSLTGAPNRRYADLILDKAFRSAQRGIPLTVVIFDLDSFKAYNDRYGHVEGDRALKVFADVLLRTTRGMNLSARYGGEEFLSIVSNGKIEGALVFVSRVREQLAECATLLEPLTVSTGLAEYSATMTEPSEIVAAADAALYASKHAGPDSVRVYGSAEVPALYSASEA